MAECACTHLSDFSYVMDTMLNIVPQSITRLPAAQQGLSKGMMVRPTPSSEPLCPSLLSR